jgi:hypothetical protein
MSKHPRSHPDLKPGDKVKVKWGVEQYTATVTHIYGPAGRRHVIVEIPILGSRGEELSFTTASVPADELVPA